MVYSCGSTGEKFSIGGTKVKKWFSSSLSGRTMKFRPTVVYFTVRNKRSS